MDKHLESPREKHDCVFVFLFFFVTTLDKSRTSDVGWFVFFFHWIELVVNLNFIGQSSGGWVVIRVI